MLMYKQNMILEKINVYFVVLLILLLAGGIIALVVSLSIREKKYTKFVENNSDALRQLNVINSNYKFKKIKSFDMVHSYDNENFYDDISPQDYLIYQLVYIQKDVLNAMNNAKTNREMFQRYAEEIKERCHFNNLGEVEMLSNKNKVLKIEKKLFESRIKNPVTEFEISVDLMLTNIQGSYRTDKDDVFSERDIKELIRLVNQKQGSYFTNRDIWDAICRVERGKVTNKMRFAIMARDGYRCVKCGRSGRHFDLEIDHIIPIAKGGKSTYDNLQTLCHKCNVKKGANIEY